MPSPSARRLTTGIAAAASLACAGVLWAALGDERRLADAWEARMRGDVPTGLRHLAAVGDSPTAAGRAAQLGAQLTYGTGDLRTTIAFLREAVDERPNDWRPHRDLAVVLAQAGKLREARRSAVRALQLNPRADLGGQFLVRGGSASPE